MAVVFNITANLIAPNRIRISYGAFPLTALTAGVNDATNPANYSVTGPGFLSIQSVTTVPDHPEAVDLVLTNAVQVAIWTITVSNVQSYSGVVCPTSTVTLPVTNTLIASVTGWLPDEGTEGFLRKYLTRAFKGRAWNALIAALALGDRYNVDNARAAYDQLWRSTAGGLYLDRRGGDYGIRRPSSVGMSDDVFRLLAIKSAANKLTPQSFLETLEAFYGTKSVRASTASSAVSPFALANGYDLQILFDGKQSVNVILSAADFINIATATAAEVAASITRGCVAAGSKAYAYPFTDPVNQTTSVQLVSGSAGIGSSVTVTGGRAQNALRFPTYIANSSTVTTTWTVSIVNASTARLTPSSTSVDLSQIQIGDYVNAYDAAFNIANRGSFNVVNVFFASSSSQYVDITNPSAVAQAAALTNPGDINFYRPTIATLYGSATPVLVSQRGSGVDVLLPATSQAVSRTKYSGAYLQPLSSLNASSITRVGNVVTVTTTAPHNLVVGQQVTVDSLSPSLAIPTRTVGNSALSDYAETTVWSLGGGTTLNGIGSVLPGYCQMADGSYFLVGGWDSTSLATVSQAAVNYTQSPVGLGDGSFRLSTTATALAVATKRLYGAACALNTTFHSVKNTNSNGVIYATGLDSTNAVNTNIYQYLPTSNTWTDTGMTLGTGTYKGTMAIVGNRLIVAGGKPSAAGASTATVQVFNLTTYASLGTLTMSSPRAEHGMAVLPNGTVLLFGGHTNTSATPVSLCDIVDPIGMTITKTGRMTLSRCTFATATLPDGRVLAIGGNGFNPSLSGATTGILTSAEIYDPSAGYWTPCGQLAVGRAMASAVYNPSLNKVIVAGGFTNLAYTTPEASTEYYDVATAQWTKSIAIDASPTGGMSVGIINGYPFAWGGTVAIGTAGNATGKVLVLNSETASSGRVNGLIATINAVPLTNTLQFNSDVNAYLISSGTPTVGVASAKPAIIPGPYVYDTKGGVAITATSTVTSATILANSTIQSIAVGSTAGFPQSGYVSFAFGSVGAVSPVKYTGLLGNSLLIDNSFVFPVAVPSGATVTLLSSIAPYVPASPQSVGSFYATSSAAGRAAATKTLNDNAAGGVILNISVKFPGDRGLGGEGQPTHGSPKLTDAVEVWGSDAVDTDLATARTN